ncbi:mitochondrial protein required for respiration [Amylostereum chailletii]|nr:mitochondrial protein required for respiration [Amylostereum chailletii]
MNSSWLKSSFGTFSRRFVAKHAFHTFRAQHTEAAHYSARRQSFFNPTLIVLGVIPIFTFTLGTWQIQRLKWKVSLIDELTEKLQREPMSLPNKVNTAVIPDFLFRKVVVRGRWDHARSMLLGPRVRDGSHGFHLITPLIRENGTTVLVDRGFVSDEHANDKNRSKAGDEGLVEVLGMLRASQARNNFTPDNHPEKGEWYWADVDAMVAYAGGDSANVQPVFIEELFEGHAGDASWRVSHGIPVGKPPIVDIRNSHASYAVTWYSLSAFTTVMFVRLLLKQRRAFSRLPR